MAEDKQAERQGRANSQTVSPAQATAGDDTGYPPTERAGTPTITTLNLLYSPKGWDMTVAEGMSIVTAHAEAPRVETDIRDPVAVDQEAVTTAIDELDSLGEFVTKHIETGPEEQPWQDTTLKEWDDDMPAVLKRSLEQHINAVKTLQNVAEELETTFGMRPQSLAEMRAVKQLLNHLSARPEINWQAAFFQGLFEPEGGKLGRLAELSEKHERLGDDLTERYHQSLFSKDGEKLKRELKQYGRFKRISPSYNSLRQEILTHGRTGYDPSHEQLITDMGQLAERQRIESRYETFTDIIDYLGPLYKRDETDWETILQARRWVYELHDYHPVVIEPVVDDLLEGTLPDVDESLETVCDALEEYDDAAAVLRTVIDTGDHTIDGVPLDQVRFPALEDRLRLFLETMPALKHRIEFNNKKARIQNTVCGEFVTRFFGQGYPAHQLVPAFKAQFYSEWLCMVSQQSQ